MVNFQTLLMGMKQFAEKWVPGLQEHLTREGLRDANKIIRDQLAERMNQVKAVLDKAKRDRVDAGSLKHLDRLDRATRKIEKVRDTIRFDSRGYRGLFDPDRENVDELMALLEFDKRLFSVIDALTQDAEKVAKLSDPELLSALGQFEDQVESMDQLLGQREKTNRVSTPAQ